MKTGSEGAWRSGEASGERAWNESLMVEKCKARGSDPGDSRIRADPGARLTKVESGPGELRGVYRRRADSPRLFLVPCFLAAVSSCSIFFSRNSCFLLSISSVSRSLWMASWGVGPPLPALPPPAPNNFPNTDMVAARRAGLRRPLRLGSAPAPAPGPAAPCRRRPFHRLRPAAERGRATSHRPPRPAPLASGQRAASYNSRCATR